MKKFKIYALVGMMALAMLSMTACNGANSEDTATTTSEPYIDAYEEDVDVKDIYSATDANGNPVTTTSPSEDGEDGTTDSSNPATTTKPSGGGSGGGATTVNPNFTTNTNQTHDDGVKFHIFRVNGVEYDITNMTGQDVYDLMGHEPDFRQKITGTVEKDGFEHCFFKFGKSLSCYFEFLDDNGELYQNTTSASRDYKEKKVQGLMFNDSDDSDFVTFAQEIRVGMEKEEIETILGKGYTLPDGAIAYKTPSVTFVIGYKTQELGVIIDGKTEMTVATAIYLVCNE